MTYRPRFQYSRTMLDCSEAVGSYRRIAYTLPLPLAVERSLRHDTRVRVAHNSTWIENRTLALQEAQAIIADKALKDPNPGGAGGPQLLPSAGSDRPRSGQALH